MTTNNQVPTLGGGGGGSPAPALGGGGGGSPAPDPLGLFVALVLVPASYPRNRFFEMFRLPDARRARRRAANVRTILKQLQSGVVDVAVRPWGNGFELRYVMPQLALTRCTRIDALELTLLAAILGRSGFDPAVTGPLAAAAGEPALAELAPMLVKLLEPG